MPSLYSDIKVSQNNDKQITGDTTSDELKSTIIAIHFIPYYYKDLGYTVNKDYSVIKIISSPGFFVDLRDYRDITDYMDKNLGSHKRQILKRVKRLEICFKPSYKLYFGEIEEDNYVFLFNRMKKFITKRFQERQAINEQLKRWEQYQKEVYSLVKEKKASIFVIYHDALPISISLNYHHKNILVHTINTYDINYYKFGLGNINIFKMLDWAFNNQYEIFDFQWGDLTYKRNWCNHIVPYHSQVLYKKSNLVSTSIAYSIAAYFRIKRSTLIYKFQKNVKTVISFFTSNAKIKTETATTEKKYSLNNTEPLISHIGLLQIDPEKDEFEFLKSFYCDFIYLNQEKVQNVKIFLKEEGSYIIQGKNHAIEVIEDRNE